MPSPHEKGPLVNLPYLLRLASLLVFTFGINVPLGYMREGVRKYSLAWFIYIHFSIPFIVALRISNDFGWEVVPLTLGCAILGQLTGGYLKRKA